VPLQTTTVSLVDRGVVVARKGTARAGERNELEASRHELGDGRPDTQVEVMRIPLRRAQKVVRILDADTTNIAPRVQLVVRSVRQLGWGEGRIGSLFVEGRIAFNQVIEQAAYRGNQTAT
jgi:hypothetical protein